MPHPPADRIPRTFPLPALTLAISRRRSSTFPCVIYRVGVFKEQYVRVSQTGIDEIGGGFCYSSGVTLESQVVMAPTDTRGTASANEQNDRTPD